LLDANGSVVGFNSDGTNPTAGIQSAILDEDLTTDSTINFGNGLSFSYAQADFTDKANNGTVELSVSYTRDGEYSGNVTTATGAQSAMTVLDDAVTEVSKQLQTLGALGSRLDFKEEALAEAQINTEAAFNRIMNADMAMSQLEATKYQILQQTATSMLAQANQAPQGLLSLFR
jgi:flagellin